MSQEDNLSEDDMLDRLRLKIRRINIKFSNGYIITWELLDNFYGLNVSLII